MATDNHNTKVSPGKNQSLMLVDLSNQKKNRTMVAKSDKDGEEAFTCLNVERPRSSGNSWKLQEKGLKNNKYTAQTPGGHRHKPPSSSFKTALGLQGPKNSTRLVLNEIWSVTNPSSKRNDTNSSTRKAKLQFKVK